MQDHIIKKVETWLVKRNLPLFDNARQGRSPMPWDIVIVRLTTDTGLVSEVSAMAPRSGNVTQSYITDNIIPVIIDRSIYEREAIWQEFWTIDRHITFFPVYLPGPIDVALWDLAAKAANLPLYKYLGAYRTSLPVYASSLFHQTVDEYVVEAKHYASKGINAYKPHPPGGWKMDMDVHQALRDELGPDAVLMTDPVAEYTLEQAIKVGRHLEKLDYYWFEEPFRDFELRKYAQLAAALDIPIAGTETTRGAHWGVAQAIQQQAVDIVRADVSWKHGITGTLKIAHLAEAFGMQCEIHTTTTGPLEMANLHISCAIRNCEYFELFIPEDVFQFPMKTPLPIDDKGMIHVPETPGIGAELDWDQIENNCTSYKVTTA
ncbi:L-alanine-DL-glutamate epimerase-like enolase superfamily enzyme [Mucilaginibacter yixingensis]|uniref:L-alanine-DL-glutamate epimerase-like enolase superfamily enzyme n=1 Tax=Mucilaginibacter yixingensis TaxID=1295612 RepID=A0A2T5JGG7_9SPHI|nr:enolase C-terminal domain-like protein [Mucilaginibacter yixingensis]PTR01533.1 L-alanine-DL-glutamate epimerase-like enolase superfamily enzyme [Mucilaginibacter yixingensis]